MIQFPGKDPYCGCKQDNQECKKLDPVNDYAQHKYIKQVTELQEQGGKEPALMQLMGFQVSISYRKNNYDEYSPKNVIQYFIEICHIAG